jgi:hypothetical protein
MLQNTCRYGGGSGKSGSYNTCAGGGGGSGYMNQTILHNGTLKSGDNTGQGYVIITAYF